jgi:hypothetical protein
METFENGDFCICSLKPDKSIKDLCIREIFVHQFQTQSSDGKKHHHEDKKILFYPDSLYQEDFDKKIIFFVCARVIGNGKSLVPIPIFMLNLNEVQQRAIMKVAEKKGLQINNRHFRLQKSHYFIDEVKSPCLRSEEVGGYENYEEDF